MLENIVKNTYCPTFNRGIFDNQGILKGGRIDKIRISLECFGQN